jgi:hypothetical protein
VDFVVKLSTLTNCPVLRRAFGRSPRAQVSASVCAALAAHIAARAAQANAMVPFARMALVGGQIDAVDVLEAIGALAEADQAEADARRRLLVEADLFLDLPTRV